MVENMSNEIVARQINEFIFKDKSLQAMCKNKNYDFNDFVACVAYQVKTNEELQKCTPQSVLDCCIKSAQIGLKIDANGYAYLTAFKGKCSVIVGYKGYVALIKANNQKVSAINSFVISNKDIEDNRLIIEEGERRTLIYKRNPLQSESSLEEKDIAGFLSIVYYKNGTYDYHFITKDDVNRIRAESSNYKYAKDVKNTIWYKHYVAMGKKTAFRQLVKWCDFSGIDKLNELDNEDYELQNNNPNTEKQPEQSKQITQSFEELCEENTDIKQDDNNQINDKVLIN